MALPRGTTGSLCPTFVSARLVCLAVRQAYAIALNERFPTALSLPSNASVTLWESTAPVKLPTIHCPGAARGDGTRLDLHNPEGGVAQCGSARAGARPSTTTTDSSQAVAKASAKLQ